MRYAERQGRPVHTHRSRRSGLAFILVLTVILGLAAIATPFVLSMIMLERTAVVDRARRQAGYGAEGVRNFAAARLSRTAEHFQRQDLEQGKDAATPYCDAEDEFVVEIRDARLKDLNIREPRGSIWGVTATDEQGKINVASAPPRIVAGLRTLLSPRVVDLKEVLTLYSGRPARWVRPQKIREIGSIAAADPRTPRMWATRVDNAFQMGMGVKVRATKPGLPPFETKVVRNGVEDLGIHAVQTDPPVPDRYLHGLLEIEMRHPVNVNTARRETLGAIFDGLAITVPTGGRPAFKTRQLTPEEAHLVTEAFYRKNLSTWHDFFQLALRLELDDLAKAAVIINALDPGNLLLHDRREGRGSLG
ncbi:MAG TPA: hypothetical protein VJU16_03610, partial [Planctomycetota bacterium]|nr:hypothetical protein [Planctomycetota bacterium]